MTVSATLAINEETDRRRRAGLRVVPLGFGEAGLPVHPGLVDALTAAAGHAPYGPVAGLDDLRTAAAGYWSRRAVPTEGHQVVAGPGSKPLLYALLHAIAGGVAMAKPSWVSYAAQAALVGSMPLLVPIRPGQGGVPDPELLAAGLARSRDAGQPVGALVVTLPDNPTGTLAAPDTVREVCEVAREHDLWVISDEIYRDLRHDPDLPFVSPAELLPERTIVTTGLSKSLALGGWRIGVARFPATAEGSRLLTRIVAIASEIWSTPAHPVQRAAAWAFAEPPELRERVRLSRRLHATVARAVAEEFMAIGADVPAPRAGFYLYPDFEPLRDVLAPRRGITDGPGLARTLLEGGGIATLPGSAFGDDEGALRLRVATSMLYGATSSQREQALAADEPLALPWIGAHLADVREGLAWLTRAGSEPESTDLTAAARPHPGVPAALSHLDGPPARLRHSAKPPPHRIAARSGGDPDKPPPHRIAARSGGDPDKPDHPSGAAHDADDRRIQAETRSSRDR